MDTTRNLIHLAQKQQDAFQKLLNSESIQPLTLQDLKLPWGSTRPSTLETQQDALDVDRAESEGMINRSQTMNDRKHTSITQMLFTAALAAADEGKIIRRTAWPQTMLVYGIHDTAGMYWYCQNGGLKKEMLWTPTSGDMNASDWEAHDALSFFLNWHPDTTLPEHQARVFAKCLGRKGEIVGDVVKEVRPDRWIDWGLTFPEAFQLMTQGVRVFRSSWDNHNFIAMDEKTGRIMQWLDNQKAPLGSVSTGDIQASDWGVVVQEPEHKISMSFSEAVDALRCGQSITRSVWRAGYRIRLTDSGNIGAFSGTENCSCEECDERTFKLSAADVLSTDWLVYEEQPSNATWSPEGREGAVDTGLDFQSAMALACEGVLVFRHAWTHKGEICLDQETNTFKLLVDGVMDPYHATPDDVTAQDWCLRVTDPAEVGLQSFETMGFRQAMEALNRGESVTRALWASGAHLTVTVGIKLVCEDPEENSVSVSCWSPTAEDVRATDWLLCQKQPTGHTDRYQDGILTAMQALRAALAPAEGWLKAWVLADVENHLQQTNTDQTDALHRWKWLNSVLGQLKGKFNTPTRVLKEEEYLPLQYLEQHYRQSVQNFNALGQKYVDGVTIDALTAILGNSIHLEAQRLQKAGQPLEGVVEVTVTNPDWYSVVPATWHLQPSELVSFLGVMDIIEGNSRVRKYRFQWVERRGLQDEAPTKAVAVVAD